MAMADYLGLRVRHFDSTDTGGCSYLVHLGQAAEAIAAGKCSIALITLAGKPRTGTMPPRATGAEADFEAAYGATTHNIYGMCAMRHMHEFGTTSAQLAWIKVAASHHAQYKPHAMLKEVVTVEDVLNSPMIADPLHRMDCCVVTDGGGALIVTSEAIARSLKKPLVRMIGHGEALKGPRGGKDLNLTYSAGVWSGPRAFEEAGVTPKDIKYASIYNSFPITALIQIYDLASCPTRHRLPRAGFLSGVAVDVLLLRQNGVGRKLGRGRDLQLQLDAQVRDRALRDRLRHLEGRPLAADQFRRLRHGQIEDRPKGQGGV